MGKRKRTVRACAEEHLAQRKTDQEVLAAVKAEFPERRTKRGSIAWYRNQMRQGSNPHNVPTMIEIRHERRRAAAEAAA